MDSLKLAPVVLFVYNRPRHTRKTLEALCENELSAESLLYVYADGPKENASREDMENIEEVRKVVRERQWCGEVKVIESDTNKGLADSIVGGVTSVVNKHGRVIVLEDDIISGKGFLKYMNQALNCYENEEKVMCISSYCTPVKDDLPETFFLYGGSCWGWGTWSRAWKHYNGSPEELIEQIENKKLVSLFNLDDTNPQNFRMLKGTAAGRVDSWAIKWIASIVLKKGLCLFPGKSLVKNIGFDNTGIHCKLDEEISNMDAVDYVDVSAIPVECSDVGFKAIKKHFKAKQPSKIQKAKHIIRQKIIQPFFS